MHICILPSTELEYESGSTIYASNIAERFVDFERFKKKYDIDFEFHAHVLRHIFATIIAEQKTHINKISMMLGHLDVKTTLSIYTHILNSRLMDESEEDKLDEAYHMLMQPNHKQHDEQRTVQDRAQDNNQQQVMQFLSSLRRRL